MRALRSCAVVAAVAAVAIASLAQAQSAKPRDHAGDRARLIGAWHLVRIEAPGADASAQPLGMLLYTQDGHMSVQLMYPKSAHPLSNEYVEAGYEASFGSYTVDEATHTVIHHIQGSVTRDLLIGKDLPRVYQFTAEGKLILRSARPEEHWSVTWQHY
jgi:hypothetical protein